MLRKITPIFLLAFLLLNISAVGQQSSKSKSSDKLYERGGKKKEVQVRNANFINSERLDFSPQYYLNGVVFVSSSKEGPKDKNTNEPFFELYYADTDRNGMPLKPEPFSVEINSQRHEGPVTFSRDMNLVYFTRNNLKNGVSQKNSKGTTGLKIYEANRGPNEWQNVKELPFNSDEFNCAHPALSPDGRKLYFSSDMPGGLGSSDLWVVEKSGDGWSAPMNLGPEINSAGRDGFPFVHETGTLFFASDRSGGLGNTDIYFVDLGENPQVTNLGEPFNSPFDDLGFILNKDGTQGYFTSSREGGFGRDDIYTFEAPEGIFGLDEPAILAVTITVVDEDGNPVQDAEVRVLERAADGFLEGDNLYDVEMVPNPDNPEELLLKLVRRDADSFQTPTLTTMKNGEAYTDLGAEKQFIILATKEGMGNSELMYSTAGITEENPKVTLVMKKPACITYSGFVLVDGTDTPLSDATITFINNCDNTAQILRSDDDGEFEYCLAPGCDYSITAEKRGFSTFANKITTAGLAPGSEMMNEIRLSPFANTVVSGPVEEGDVIILQNIYYDFGKSAIRTGAARELDALGTLMKKYPSMEIELIAHTDSRGSAEFNLELSLKRAESAKNYLTNRGIAENRVKAFGYGESQLRNDCADGVECTDEEHEFNRRTEVRITKIDKPVKVEYRVKKP